MLSYKQEGFKLPSKRAKGWEWNQLLSGAAQNTMYITMTWVEMILAVGTPVGKWG